MFHTNDSTHSPIAQKQGWHPWTTLLPIVLSALIFALPCLGGNSVISTLFPFGIPLQSLSGASLSMGGIAAGYAYDHNIMLRNPGNLGAIPVTSFSVLAMVDYLRIHQPGHYTDHIDMRPQQFSFAIPLTRVGTFAFSLSKESDASLRFREPRLIVPGSNPQNPIFSQMALDRTGGIVAFGAGWGRKFGQYVSAGIGYQRLYTTITGTRLSTVTLTNIINNVEVPFETLTETDSTIKYFTSNGLRLGVLGQAGRFSFGLSGNYYPEADGSMKRTVYNTKTVSDTIQKEKTAITTATTLTVTLPPSLIVGAAYQVNPRLFAGMDVAVDFWEYYHHSAVAGVPPVEKNNTVSIMAGGRYIPAPNLLLPKYWETIHYRSGARYTQLPGQSGSEIALSLGVGLPLRGNGLLDIAFEGGRRTLADESSVKESFVHIGIGINGGKKWRQSSKQPIK